MMHLQKYEKPYILIRTQVDADVIAAFRRKMSKVSEEEIRNNIIKIKEQFLSTDEVKAMKHDSVHFTGIPIYVMKSQTEVTFNDEYEKIHKILVQAVCDAINKPDFGNQIKEDYQEEKEEIAPVAVEEEEAAATVEE